MSKRRQWVGRALVGAFVAGMVVALASPAFAGGARKTASAKIDGFQNVPMALFTTGEGRVWLRKRANRIYFLLRYKNLEGDITASAGAHIHFGQPGLDGGVLAFLCEGAGGAPPGTPSCTDDGTGTGAVSGYIYDEDVLPVEAQKFPGGSVDDLWRVIQGRGAYINVHTSEYPTGEIRGAVR